MCYPRCRWVLCERTRPPLWGFYVTQWTMIITGGPKLKPGKTYITHPHTYMAGAMSCLLIYFILKKVKEKRSTRKCQEVIGASLTKAHSFLIKLLKFPCHAFLLRHVVIIKYIAARQPENIFSTLSHTETRNPVCFFIISSLTELHEHPFQTGRTSWCTYSITNSYWPFCVVDFSVSRAPDGGLLSVTLLVTFWY